MHPTTIARSFQPTRRMMQSVPKEEHAAHTISQRLRRLRQIPPELIPLGLVVGLAVGLGCYSLGHKLMVDKTMRLWRKGHSD